MNEILLQKHYRKVFYFVVVLLLAFILAVRFFTIPHFQPNLSISLWASMADLADKLATSLLVTVFIGSFIFWLTPDIVKRSPIEVVEPKRINPLLTSAASLTKSWIYQGACGRYTRAATLPMMAQAAKTEGFGRDITICVLNPKNNDLCTEYATYRRSLKSGSEGVPWTCETVQEEVIATAVSAMRYQTAEPLLRIRVFFVNSFSAFRFDISDQYVVITKEEKDAAALKADVGTYFYDSYKDDIRLTERLATQLACCGKVEFLGDMTESTLRAAVACADIVDESTLSKLDIKKICAGINSPVRPY
jgi:hypothetical protein